MARAGRHAGALAAWDDLRLRDLAAFTLVASDYADSAVPLARTPRRRTPAPPRARTRLDLLHARSRAQGMNWARTPPCCPTCARIPP
jgi:hypothetical protein